MDTARHDLSQWAVQFAPKFLEMIGVPHGDKTLAAAGLDWLSDLLDDIKGAVEGGRPDPRPRLRDALKALETLHQIAVHTRSYPFGRHIEFRWRDEIAQRLVCLEENFAKHDGPCFQPIEIRGTVQYAVWDLEEQLRALARAISAVIAEVEGAKKAKAHRPPVEWKHESMFACVWLAYELRRQAGVADPVPNMKNGALAPLFGFATSWMNLAEATSEKYARVAVALVGRVHNGTLSDVDRRFICGARYYVTKKLWGELAAISDPDDDTGEQGVQAELHDPDPIRDLRERTGL